MSVDPGLSRPAGSVAVAVISIIIGALAAIGLGPGASADAVTEREGDGEGKGPSRRARPPNILFIMADDLGREWIGCYGGEDIETPEIDALAERGMRFTNAYSMAQCTPTRVTLFAGQYPFRHGWVNHWDVPRWGAGCHFDWRHNASFARLVRDAGYATAIAGKWQINDFRVQPDALEKHGFDEWCVWTGYETGNPPSAERYWDPYLHTREGSRARKGRFGTDVFVDFLIDFMERHRDRPMLLYFPMALTHTPLVATPLEPDAEGKLERHRAMVRYTDHAVGRLVRALERLGLRERTIVVFTTDNGTTRGIANRMNGRRVRGGKASLGENGVRQPFIASAPGLVPEGVVTSALTDFTDVLPTFVELAGARLPKDRTVDGRSIAPLLLGKAEDSGRDWILSMGYGPARLVDGRVRPARKYADRVVRDERWKLWVVDGRPARLHDLERDTAEEENLIESEREDASAARRRLEEVIATLPRRDASPRYDPTPPQPWDRKR